MNYHKRKWAWVLAVIIVIPLMLLPYALGRATSHYNPISLNSVAITSHIPGTTFPAVHVGQPVGVSGVICVSGTDNITVLGDLKWQSVVPVGSTIEVGTGSLYLQAGCHAARYSVSMPKGVVDQSSAAFASGLHSVQWKITGTDTPDIPGSTTSTFSTGPFLVLP